MRVSVAFPHSLRRLATSCMVVAGAATTVHAQTSYIGPRIGYNFDARAAFVSMQLSVPLSKQVDFSPSVDVYAPEVGSLNAINGNLRVRFPITGGPNMYTGGGLNILTRTFDNDSRTHVGANLFFGIEGRTGRVHPFFETRVLMHLTNSVEMAGGLNIAIGR